MKNFFVTLALLSAVVSFGQTAIKKESKPSEAKSLLWKISGKGLKAPSYLFGTMHLTCDASLDAATRDALENTQQLYLEMDMDDPEMQAAMMGGMMMQDGKTMDAMVSEADFKLLDAYLQEKMGISAAMLNTIKPFMVSTMFLPSMMDCPIQAVETELMKISTAQNEETFGLETIEEQMAVFEAIPYQDQMNELMKSVKDKFAASKTEMKKMMDIYKSKDIDAMITMMNESENTMNSAFQDVLLNSRNKKWIPKIEAVAKDKPTFFGVGAAHLGGKEGVIALLRSKGYKVEAVMN